MNGWQFRDEQLKDPALSGIPVIVMTASRDLRNISADEVVYKPLKLDRLLEVVRRHARVGSPASGGNGKPTQPLGGRSKADVEAGLLRGGAEMGTLVRAKYWAQTPLGSIESWPRALQCAASLCLASRYPIIIFWTRNLIQIYNDAFIPIAGRKHPSALGQGAKECWPEMWDTIAPLFEYVFAKASATRSDNLPVPLERHGYLEEAFYTFSYTPIVVESGEVGGIFNVILETTDQVLAERRTRAVRDVVAQIALAKSVPEACASCARALEGNADIRFALIYLLGDDEILRLANAAGIPAGGPASPLEVAISASEPWPFAEVLDKAGGAIVAGVHHRFGVTARGPWGHPVEKAMVLPLPRVGQRPWGALVLGLTPQRAPDDEFRTFLEQIASHVATAIGSAHAYQQERARAEALVELDRAKTTFFSNVSHEFRTPLTLMLGPTEDLLGGVHGELNEDIRERLTLVHRNELRLQKLVNALLDFSRIEAGRIEATCQPVDLAMLTSDLASTFRSAVERAGLEFEVDCAPLVEPRLRRPGHVGENRPQSPLERLQIYV